jgi:hypothetical protein
MSTASTIPRRGNPAVGDVGSFHFNDPMRAAALEHRCKAHKLDANMLDKLWDEIQATNRAAGPWGIALRRAP